MRLAPTPMSTRSQARKLHVRAARKAVPPKPGTGRPRHTPVEQLRLGHLADMVRALRDGGPQSRTQLCRSLGLSSTTLSKLALELLRSGWVTESEVRRQKDVGRPQTAIALMPQACRVASVLVEPDALHTTVAGLDAVLGPVHSQAAPLATQDPERSIEQVAQAVLATLRQERAQGRPMPQAVCVALPGLTDSRWRTLLRSTQMGWGPLPLAERLEALTGLPVQIHNNTRAMAFAEFRHLGLDEEQPLLFVQARFGLGAAMVNSARASRHGHFGASDLGFIPLGTDTFSRPRNDNRPLVDVTREAYLCRVLDIQAGSGPVLPVMEERCASGDATARRLYVQTLDNLAAGLGIAVDILAPRVVVLGGIYAHASEHFANELKARLQHRAQAELVAGLTVRRSALGRSGALQGAALVAFDHLLADGAVFERP